MMMMMIYVAVCADPTQQVGSELINTSRDRCGQRVRARAVQPSASIYTSSDAADRLIIITDYRWRGVAGCQRR